MPLLSSMTSLQARERWLAIHSVWVGMMLWTANAAQGGLTTAVREREVSQPCGCSFSLLYVGLYW
jgi:hypothetical protein